MKLRRIAVIIVVVIMALGIGYSTSCACTPTHDDVYQRLLVASDLLDDIMECNELSQGERNTVFLLWMDASSLFIHDDLVNADLKLKEFGDSPVVDKYLSLCGNI